VYVFLLSSYYVAYCDPLHTAHAHSTYMVRRKLEELRITDRKMIHSLFWVSCKDILKHLKISQAERWAKWKPA